MQEEKSIGIWFWKLPCTLKKRGSTGQNKFSGLKISSLVKLINVQAWINMQEGKPENGAVRASNKLWRQNAGKLSKYYFPSTDQVWLESLMENLSQIAAESKTNWHAEVQLSDSHLGFHTRYQSSAWLYVVSFVNGATDMEFAVKLIHQNKEKILILSE